MRQFLNLLNGAFPVPAGASFFDDFPVWDEAIVPAGESLCRLGVFDGARLVAGAGVWIAPFKTLDKALPAAQIGAVVTAPEYQGRGFASELVKTALEWAANRGASVALLSGLQEGLYARLGFEPAGAQARLPLSELSHTNSHPVSRGWNRGIFTLMKQRELGIALADSDMYRVEAHKNVHWYWTGDRHEVSAYAAIGKGIDLTGFVHEWGGERGALNSILAQVRNDHPEAVLLAPRALLQKRGFPESATMESVCLMKALSAERIAEEYLWIWGLDGA